MEGLFQEGEHAATHVLAAAKTTFVGRSVAGTDRAIKAAFNIAYKRMLGTHLEGRGYQHQGLNMPPSGAVLTRGQREVRFCSYRTEAGPFLREARCIAAELLASNEPPATGLVLGKGECLMRIAIPEEIGSCEHAQGFARRQGDDTCGCFGTALGFVGGQDLLVFDVRVSEHTKASVKGICDKCFGTNRQPPAYYLNQAAAAVAAKIAMSREGKIQPTNRKYIKFTTPKAEEQYLLSVKLLLLAFALDRAQDGVNTAVHCIQLNGGRTQKMTRGSAEDEEPIWFPPNRAHNSATAKLEEAIEALNRVQGTTIGLVPCLPATEFAGTPYEAMTVTMTDDQHEELLKQHLKAEDGPSQNAFFCGPNLTGARPPLDTKHPITWATAYSRHFCEVNKTIPLPNGEKLVVVMNKEHEKHKKLRGHELRVWKDLNEMEAKYFREWLQKPINRANLHCEGKPHSISQETYDCIHGEVLWDQEYGARDIIRACVFAKSGEGVPKGRFITMPGVSQEDALKHQCGCSAITQIMESFHTDQFGFRNFKGCSLTGKALKVARFIAQTPDDCVVIGYDKAANDATWTQAKWAQYEDYSMKMAAILTDAYFYTETPAVLDADAEHARKIEWRGIYLTVAANIQYYYLMSAVGPTSLSNRKGGDTSVGSAILQGYGEKHYEEWLQWMSGETAEPLDDFDIKYFPHLEKGILVKENLTTGFAHSNEGDDTKVRIKRMKGQTNSEAVCHFTKSLTAATLEVWEPAYISESHLNSHGGPRSCVEITSMVVAQFTNEDGECQFAHVPKPIKRLDKMAWTLSAALRVAETPSGRVGVADATYHRLNATRCLSMATEMRFALFTRYVVYQTAKYHLQKLRTMPKAVNNDTPLYGDRTMEARHMPEATGYIGDSIERAFHVIGEVFARTDVSTPACLEANANAWGLASPLAMKDGKCLRDTLIQLDEVARGIDVEESHIVDPVSYLSMFQLGPLESCFADSAGRLKKAVELNEKEALPFEVLRQKLIDSVAKPKDQKNTTGANAQSQPRAPTPNKANGGALGRSDKGGNTAGPRPSRW